MIEEIDALREELSRMRPLTQREIERLRKSFIEEYTYNSTAIEGNVDAENLGDLNTANLGDLNTADFLVLADRPRDAGTYPKDFRSIEQPA